MGTAALEVMEPVDGSLVVGGVHDAANGAPAPAGFRLFAVVAPDAPSRSAAGLHTVLV